MRLTFFGGINEIGGNKILLEEKNSSVFLDFGKSYKEAALYFEEFVNPRAVHGIKDYLELDLIPKKQGIYREDLVEILKKENHEISSYDKLQLSAVLLSHSHMDHAAYLSFINEKIPVYLTNASYLVLKVFNIIKQTNLENEIFEIGYPHFFEATKRKKIRRNFKIVYDFKPFNLENFKITPILVDHSAPGATMFLIKSGNKKILYSGDFRLSEIKKEALNKIIDYLKKEKINYFLCEGTRIKETKVLKEEEVFKKAKEQVSNVKGLIVADYSLTDTTRFLTLQRIAREIKRKIALPFNYFGYLIFLKEAGFNIEIDKTTVLYGKKKSKLKKWESALLKNHPFVEAEEIQKNKKDYFVILNFYQIQELIDLKPDKNSYFLRAITEPHSEEMEISEGRFINWIKHFEMKGLTEEGKFERAHISGHISGKELEEFINKIKPDLVIPIHTEHPEEFKKIYSPPKIIIPEKNQTIYI
ncbi:MAG: MBL fold metallo-hydrolase [Minisyncoccia bacterium]